MCVCACSVVSDSFEIPETVAHQAPLPMEVFRQELWSGLPLPTPGDLHNPGIKPRSPALEVDSYQLNHKRSPHMMYSAYKLNTQGNTIRP